MFYFVTKKPRPLKQALIILAFYCVRMELFVDEKEGVLTIKVDEETREGDLRLAEMAFQGIYRQKGKVCLECSEHGEEVCGHLTFVP